MVDWQGLAEIAPVLASGFTGKPETVRNVAAAYQHGQKIRDDQALRSFGRELFSLGHPPDEMEIQSLASKYGLDPFQTQALVKTFIEEKRQKKLMKLKEREDLREDKKLGLEERKVGVLERKPTSGAKVIPPGGKLVNDVTGDEIATGNPRQDRPVGMPAWYDSMAKETLGSKMNDPVELAKFEDWITTKEGKQAAAAYRQQYAKETATPYYPIVATSEGIVKTNAREPGGTTTDTGLKKPMPSEMLATGSQIETLNEAKKRFTANYKPEYVGPIYGRVGRVREKLTGVPKEQAQFYSDVTQVNNMLVYIMSGKQINEQEQKRLMDQLPYPNLPAPTFEARLASLDDTVKTIMSYRDKHTGAYQDTGEQPQQPSAQSTAQPKQTQAAAQPSQADLEYTAKKYGITVDEVKKKLGIQ